MARALSQHGLQFLLDELHVIVHAVVGPGLLLPGSVSPGDGSFLRWRGSCQRVLRQVPPGFHQAFNIKSGGHTVIGPLALGSPKRLGIGSLHSLLMRPLPSCELYSLLARPGDDGRKKSSQEYGF